MNFSLLSAVQIMAGDSTIPADKTNLGAGTVASVVITGIVVVFIALILLILFVSIYGKIFDTINTKAREKAEEKANMQKNATSSEVSVEKAVPSPVVENGIEEETVAVIMGAISAMSSESGKRLVLKSVKTAKPQRPAWASAGIVENTRPF